MSGEQKSSTGAVHKTAFHYDLYTSLCLFKLHICDFFLNKIFFLKVTSNGVSGCTSLQIAEVDSSHSRQFFNAQTGPYLI